MNMGAFTRSRLVWHSLLDDGQVDPSAACRKLIPLAYLQHLRTSKLPTLRRTGIVTDYQYYVHIQD
jgi:hypothetical protein